MPSESIAELPVTKAAINLVTAMARFPAIAAKIAVLDSLCMAWRVRTPTGPGSWRLIVGAVKELTENPFVRLGVISWIEFLSTADDPLNHTKNHEAPNCLASLINGRTCLTLNILAT